MTIKNYVIIENNLVTNVVVWDGDTTQWQPPQGSIALPQVSNEGIGWTYDGANFIAPPPALAPEGVAQPATIGTQDL
jgi:hypothetical protein